MSSSAFHIPRIVVQSPDEVDDLLGKYINKLSAPCKINTKEKLRERLRTRGGGTKRSLETTLETIKEEFDLDKLRHLKHKTSEEELQNNKKQLRLQDSCFCQQTCCDKISQNSAENDINYTCNNETCDNSCYDSNNNERFATSLNLTSKDTKVTSCITPSLISISMKPVMPVSITPASVIKPIPVTLKSSSFGLKRKLLPLVPAMKCVRHFSSLTSKFEENVSAMKKMKL